MPGPNAPYTLLDDKQTIQQAFVETQDAHRVIPITGTSGQPIGPTNPLFISSLPFAWDYVSEALSNGNTTETFTFKTGGSGGTNVGTVVINYTNSSRDLMLNATITRL